MRIQGHLLGALKPASKQDGSPTDLMEELYKDHTNDPDTMEKAVLGPSTGGGTTVVEALRLGCTVTGTTSIRWPGSSSKPK